jgi:hypothetical protein
MGCRERPQVISESLDMDQIILYNTDRVKNIFTHIDI